MNLFLRLSLFLMIANANAAAVNCGKALKDAAIPACIVMEDAPRFGCGKDPLIHKGQRWAGKSQTKLAQKKTGKDMEDCLQSFSMTYTKDGCCRSDLPKTARKAKPAAKQPVKTKPKK